MAAVRSRTRGALGRRQAVRQRFLVPPCGGSNPPAPAIGFRFHGRGRLFRFPRQGRDLADGCARSDAALSERWGFPRLSGSVRAGGILFQRLCRAVSATWFVPRRSIGAFSERSPEPQASPRRSHQCNRQAQRHRILVPRCRMGLRHRSLVTRDALRGPPIAVALGGPLQAIHQRRQGGGMVACAVPDRRDLATHGLSAQRNPLRRRGAHAARRR